MKGEKERKEENVNCLEDRVVALTSSSTTPSTWPKRLSGFRRWRCEFNSTSSFFSSFSSSASLFNSSIMSPYSLRVLGPVDDYYFHVYIKLHWVTRTHTRTRKHSLSHIHTHTHTNTIIYTYKWVCFKKAIRYLNALI